MIHSRPPCRTRPLPAREGTRYSHGAQMEISRLNDIPWERIARFLGKEAKRRSTGVVYMLCVNHSEKTPSLVCGRRSNRFKCYGCGAQGNRIDLVTLALFNGCTSDEVSQYELEFANSILEELWEAPICKGQLPLELDP
jgi:hypothetical protein